VIAAGSVSLDGTLTASFATDPANLDTSEYAGADITIVATEGGIIAEGLTTTPSLGPFPGRVRPPANGTELPAGSVRLNANTEISVSGTILVAAGIFAGDTLVLDEDDASGLGGFVSLVANEQITVSSIVGSQNASIDQDDPDPLASAARGPATMQPTATPAVGTAASPPAISVASIRGSGAVLVRASRGPIGLGGDVTTGPRGSSPASVTFDGDLVLSAPARIHTTVASVGSGTAGAAGDVTFTGRVDGRYPLAIAAGAGAVSFGDVVGGAIPLAGLRFDAAGRVTAADRVHLAGGTTDALRHGIELAPGVTDVDLSRGGTLRNFASGHAVHIPGGARRSTISGFRIVNSGHPFVGWGGSEGTSVLQDNAVVRPVPRPKASVPTLVGGSGGGTIPDGRHRHALRRRPARGLRHRRPRPLVDHVAGARRRPPHDTGSHARAQRCRQRLFTSAIDPDRAGHDLPRCAAHHRGAARRGGHAPADLHVHDPRNRRSIRSHPAHRPVFDRRSNHSRTSGRHVARTARVDERADRLD